MTEPILYHVINTAAAYDAPLRHLAFTDTPDNWVWVGQCVFEQLSNERNNFFLLVPGRTRYTLSRVEYKADEEGARLVLAANISPQHQAELRGMRDIQRALDSELYRAVVTANTESIEAAEEFFDLIARRLPRLATYASKFINNVAQLSWLGINWKMRRHNESVIVESPASSLLWDPSHSETSLITELVIHAATRL